jgi:hypothetical protein
MRSDKRHVQRGKKNRLLLPEIAGSRGGVSCALHSLSYPPATHFQEIGLARRALPLAVALDGPFS